MSRPGTGVGRTGFVERHGLWTAEQALAGAELAGRIDNGEIETLRFSFADQHGIARGKALIGDAAKAALASGVSLPSTLLTKDTSHATVFPAFSKGSGLGLDELTGGVGYRAGRRSRDLRHAALGGAHRLGAVRRLFHKRPAGAVFRTADSATGARTAGRGGPAADYRAGNRIPPVPAGRPASGAGRRDPAGHGARGQPAGARLPLSHRDPARRAGAGRRTAAYQPARNGAAIAVDRMRVRAEPG